MNRIILAIAAAAFTVLVVSAANAGPPWGPPGWPNGPPDPCGPNLCKPQPVCHTVYVKECVDYQPIQGGGWRCVRFEDVPHQECN